MTPCSKFIEDLPLHVSGDLGEASDRALRTHLASCQSCQVEVEDYKSVRSIVAAAFPPAGGLSGPTRARIAAVASDDAVRHPWWRVFLPLPPSPALAAVVPAAIVALAIALPLALRTGSVPHETAQAPTKLDMQAAGGVVRVAWSDGRGKPYKVYKSNDPRMLGRGAGQEVRGNQWVDDDPDSSPIVFYRVE